MHRITPLKAIRLKCLDCCAGNKLEVKLCSIEDCAIFPYRFGKNPARRWIGRKLPSITINRAVSNENMSKNLI